MVQLAASKMQPLISKLQPLRSGTAVCLLLTLTALYAAVCANGDACAGAAQTPAVPADDGSNASASTKKEQ